MSEKKLLDQLRDLIRTKHLSIRTEKTYVQWAKRFILYHNKTHPARMGAEQINQYLTFLAVKKRVAAPTQNQDLNDGTGTIYLPFAIERKYKNAGKDWRW